jgi:hypothetical protein
MLKSWSSRPDASYSYDAAKNQTQRFSNQDRLASVRCPPGGALFSQVDNLTSVRFSGGIQVHIYRQESY